MNILLFGCALLAPGLSGFAQREKWSIFPLGQGVIVAFPTDKVYELKEEPPVRAWTSLVAGCSFSVSQTTFKPGEIKDWSEEWIAQCMQGLLEDAPGALITEQREFLWEGWPAFQVTCKDPKKGDSQTFRGVRTGKQLVDMAVVWPSKADKPKTAEAFLDSLAFTGTDSEGPFKSTGPHFKPYKLDTSDITASFPHPPEKKVTKTGVGELAGELKTFTSTYLDMQFVVGFLEIPVAAGEPSPEDLGQGLDHIANEIAESMKAKIGKTKDVHIGADDGTESELNLEAGFGSTLLILKHRFSIVVAFAVAPKAILHSSDVEGFFKSVSFSLK